MDRFQSLQVFVCAVEEGSLVAAARRFGLSASMAGKHVSALEAQLGVRLLHRSTRSLNATEAGRRYYQRAKAVLENLEEANHEARDQGSALGGTLRVAVPVTFGALYMAALLAQWMGDYPQVKVEVIADDRYVDLHEAGIDLAIRIGQLPDSSLVARRLAACRMVLCAAPAFIQREGPLAHPDALRTLPRLAFSEAVSAHGWTLFDGDGRGHRIAGPVRLQANNMQMLLAAAQAGLGLAYGPTFIFGPSLREGRLQRLLPGYEAGELTVQAVYPTARYVPSKVRSLVEYLLQAFADELPWDDE